MSTTYPHADSLRIPPKPRMARARRPSVWPPSVWPLNVLPLNAVALQLVVSAVSAFGLAWLLSHLIIG